MGANRLCALGAFQGRLDTRWVLSERARTLSHAAWLGFRVSSVAMKRKIGRPDEFRTGALSHTPALNRPLMAALVPGQLAVLLGSSEDVCAKVAVLLKAAVVQSFSAFLQLLRDRPFRHRSEFGSEPSDFSHWEGEFDFVMVWGN